ncbi:hypothetical protein DFH09DRAFT_1080615 [Mycena vulgaris]|nr:hypothetical protein DFH09DRAFT_1080615 [Mycena vulgaris]
MAYDPISQELVDLIVDNLHDDIPALKSCSLAARTFKNRNNTASGWQKSPKPLREALQAPDFVSPHSTAVDELCIVLVGSETSFEYDEEGQYLTEPHVTWIMTGRTLSLVLPLLDLRRISLVENSPADWNSAGKFSMNWNKMGHTLKSALTEVFSSPNLEAVQLRGIVIESPFQLLSLFSEATSLKELSLSRVYFTQGGSSARPGPVSDPWRPQLRFLLVSDTSGSNLAPYLLNPRIDLTRVKSLCVAVIANSTWEWRDKIVSQTTGSGAVEHLRLFYPSEPQFFQLLSALFTACPHDSRLETIIIEGPIVQSGVNFSRWDQLNDTIDQLAVHLSSLKIVEIKVFVGPGRTLFSEWSGATWSLLPSLVQRGMLTLTEIPVAHGVHHGWEYCLCGSYTGVVYATHSSNSPQPSATRQRFSTHKSSRRRITLLPGVVVLQPEPEPELELEVLPPFALQVPPTGWSQRKLASRLYGTPDELNSPPAPCLDPAGLSQGSQENADLFQNLALDIVVSSSHGFRLGAVSKWVLEAENGLAAAIGDFPKRGVLRSTVPTWAWNLVCQIPNARLRLLYDSDKIMAEFVSTRVCEMRAQILLSPRKTLRSRSWCPLLVHKYPNGETMSEGDVISDAMGHIMDTTSTSLTYFLWELPRRQDILRKLQHEIDGVMPYPSVLPDVKVLNGM